MAAPSDPWANDVARTERERTRVTVKERKDGTPFLWFDLPGGVPMPSFPETWFGLDLRPGTTYAQARQLADLMSDRVEGLFATIYPPQATGEDG